MYYYIKFAGDEPVIIKYDYEVIPNKEFGLNPEDVYFIVAVQTQQGYGTMPVPATDNGLDNSEIVFSGDKITMSAALNDDNSLVKLIKEINLRKSGIVTPKKPSIIMP